MCSLLLNSRSSVPRYIPAGYAVTRGEQTQRSRAERDRHVLTRRRSTGISPVGGVLHSEWGLAVVPRCRQDGSGCGTCYAWRGRSC